MWVLKAGPLPKLREVRGTDASIVQRAREQRAGGARCFHLLKVFDGTDTARRIDLAAGHASGKSDDQSQIRSLVAADPLQVHRQHALRPIAFGMCQQCPRSPEIITLIVQREHWRRGLTALADHGKEVGIEEGFAPDDRTAQPRIEPVRERGFVAHAGVRPEFEFGEMPMDGSETFHVAAAALDGIEVGDIQGLEWMKCEQGFHDFRWFRSGAQPGADRAVFVAPAFAGMDYHAVLEVDHGNQVEAGHG